MTAEPNYCGLQISTKHWMPKLLLLPDDRAAEPLAIGDKGCEAREQMGKLPERALHSLLAEHR
jgi:hypothetical protein